MRRALLLSLLAGCAAQAPQPGPVARAVAEEPRPVGAPIAFPGGAFVFPPRRELGAPGPAVRVAGTISRPAATEAMLRLCREAGVESPSPPVRFDDPTAEFVFYVDCAPPR